MTQSRDVEAEMQQLIQSRVRNGQPALPALKLNSGVGAFPVTLLHYASTQVF